MDRDDKTGLNPNMANFFSKHLVEIIISLKKDFTTTDFKISSFVLEINNFWFLITSAHCFRKLEEIKDEGYCLTAVKLIDAFGINPIDLHYIPFALNDLNPINLDSFNPEFDIALITLKQYYVNLLRTNRIEAFDENAWSMFPSKFESFWVFGMPTETNITTERLYKLKTIGFRVFPIQQVPEEYTKFKYPRFIGKLESCDSLNSIQGMSGGPILGFANNRYWLVAIQSGWLPYSRIINGVPTKEIIEAISQLITEKSKAKQKNIDGA